MREPGKPDLDALAIARGALREGVDVRPAAYFEQKVAEGKTHPEAPCCLKRQLPRTELNLNSRRSPGRCIFPGKRICRPAASDTSAAVKLPQ